MNYWMDGLKPLRVGTSLKLPLFLISLTLVGCAPKNIVLHPLTGTDFYDGKNPGDVCFSKFYWDDVIGKIKIDKSR